MAFVRRWFLILSALLLGGGQLFAASREQRAYSAAIQAFNDQNYSVAESWFTQFLQTYRKSTNAPMAVLRLAQSEFYLKDYASAAKHLADNRAQAAAAGLADQYVYWQAEAEFAQSDFGAAARTFVSLTEDFPGSPAALSAVVGAAKACAQSANWAQLDRLLDNTNGLFQRAARLDPSGEQVANGRLLQSESRYAQGDFAAAIRALSWLNVATLTPQQDWQRAYLLYSANLGLTNFDAALAAAANLREIARLGHGDEWATNLAVSVECRARVLKKLGRLAEATSILEENLSNSVPAGLQQQAYLKLADLAVTQTNLPGAEARLEDLLAIDTNSPSAQTARLTLGELYLTNYLAQPSATNNPLSLATNELDQFLAAFTNSPLRGRAYLARGWCNWLAAQMADDARDTDGAVQMLSNSLSDFQDAAQLLPVSADQAVARFKTGDAQFRLGHFAAAQTNYQAVLRDFSALPQVTNALAGPAIYQILRARLALGEVSADDSMRQLLAKLSAGGVPEGGLLLAGQALSDFGSPADAREVFQEFKLKHANSPLMPEVAFASARTYEQEQNWAAAITNYQAWLQTYPTNDLRLKVEFARARAVAQTGDEARAFGLFTNFIASYPANRIFSPRAYWWLADHYFRLGTNYTAAETDYQLIFQNFPTNELAYQAQLMAGRSALGRFSWDDASKYFLGVLDDTNCPDDLKDQARFAYCEALRGLAPSDTNNVSLQKATNVLAQITSRPATNLVVAMAWSETGDCDLQLGALDAATNAYVQVVKSLQVLNSSGTSQVQELRGHAQVGLGKALDTKAEADGLPDDARTALLGLAMESYAEVFYSTNETQDAWWTNVAGMRMLALARRMGDQAAAGRLAAELKSRFPPLKGSSNLTRGAAEKD